MSLLFDTKEIISDLERLQKKAEHQQRVYFNLINNMVRLHQKYRIAKNYEISDEIRAALNSVGVTIIQGTAQYGGYENIPPNMRNRQGDDTWFIDE